MVKVGEDSYGLQNNELQKFRLNFLRYANRAPLILSTRSSREADMQINKGQQCSCEMGSARRQLVPVFSARLHSTKQLW